MSRTTRREFLRVLGGLAAGASLGEAFASATGARERRPNVVLIVADDLGRECLASYGGTSWETPHLAALAAGGMRFSHCYATPWCFPSRVQLLTGQYLFRYAFREVESWGTLDVDERPTFARLLQRAGYATCVAGKWHLCSFDDPANADHPLRAGFDEHCLWYWEHRDPTGQLRPTSKYWDPWIWQNGRLRAGLEGRYGPDVFSGYLVDFIERNRSRPFLAFYPMVLPHAPFEPTPRSGALARSVGYLPTRIRHRFAELYFGDYLAYLDLCVGRVVAALDRLGLREQTLLLFTSDNGTDRSIRSAVDGRLVRGGKGSMTDLGAHVPLLASWPGTVAKGSVCEDLVDLSDIFPALAHAAGVGLPVGAILDGRSFLPQLRSETGNPREWVYFQSLPWWDFDRAVRSKEWKLLASGALYHMTEDPWEERPIPPGAGSPEAAEARKRLQAVLDALDQGAEPSSRDPKGD